MEMNSFIQINTLSHRLQIWIVDFVPKLDQSNLSREDVHSMDLLCVTQIISFSIMEPEEPGEVVTPRSGEGSDITCRTQSVTIYGKIYTASSADENRDGRF